jgi:hypothetical protein
LIPQVIIWGIPEKTMSSCWRMCQHKDEKTKPEHLLWALKFMKTYATEENLAKEFGVTRKTLRKWIWATIEGIAKCRKQVVSRI